MSGSEAGHRNVVPFRAKLENGGGVKNSRVLRVQKYIYIVSMFIRLGN